MSALAPDLDARRRTALSLWRTAGQGWLVADVLAMWSLIHFWFCCSACQMASEETAKALSIATTRSVTARNGQVLTPRCLEKRATAQHSAHAATAAVSARGCHWSNSSMPGGRFARLPKDPTMIRPNRTQPKLLRTTPSADLKRAESPPFPCCT